MIDFVIRLAEIPIYIECNYESTKEFCKEYLCEDKPQFRLAISKEDLDYEKVRSDRFSANPYLETLALYRKIAEVMIQEDTLLFHSSSIEIDGEAYLFAAPSGTGKTTHTLLWKECLTGHDIHIINGDKPLIKIKRNSAFVYGTPWRGKENLGENRASKVKAICFLNQGKANNIWRIEETDAFPKLLKQTYRTNDKLKLKNTLALLQNIAKMVPVYEMECTVSQEAAITGYNYMKGDLKDEIEE